MNRLMLLDGHSQAVMFGSESERPRGTSRSDARPDGARLLFLPQQLERAYAYPLLVWLHGKGGNERQLLDVMPRISRRNYAGVAPRGQVDADGAGSGSAVCYWQQTPEGIDAAWSSVQASMGVAFQRMKIARQRVFIAGYADGGTMALRLAFAHPEMFLGVASINGPFPRGDRPFRRFHASRALSLFLAVGRESMMCDEAQVADDLRVLHPTGASVMLCQYETDDDPTTVMFEDSNRWLMDRVSGTRTLHRSVPSQQSSTDRN